MDRSLKSKEKKLLYTVFREHLPLWIQIATDIDHHLIEEILGS